MEQELSFAERCQRLVRNLGLAGADEAIAVRALSGGVGSDIGIVRFSNKELCVKFALPRLKVATRWEAPVGRNRAEYAWLAFARSCVPNAAPRLHGWSETDGGFAMELVTGPDVYLWKRALLEGQLRRYEAQRVGEALGRIHATSAGPDFDRTGFDNLVAFEALRIEPYLEFTASRHPSLAGPIRALASGLRSANDVLVHGDVSPKNILFRTEQPVFIDAECATMGDACFDVAFCLNHLVVKALHLPAIRSELFGATNAFWNAYAPQVNWEDADALEARVSALLPALMLARIDGRSPVEYLSESTREQVRSLSMPMILKPPTRISELIDHIKNRESSA